MRITWSNVREAKAAVRQMAEEGVPGLLCPTCNERLELRGESSCPLGRDSSGSFASFSIGEMKTKLCCPKSHTQKPLPAQFRKELAKRLTVETNSRKKDQNGEEKS